MNRGFAMIGLHNPKNGQNVGGALRAVACYDAAGLIIDGPRRNKLIRHPSDTMATYRHIPVQWVDDIFAAMPFACVPVAVEITPRAPPLDTFEHPQSAIYIFGAEDATLGEATLRRCAHTVFIPTQHCMNLAATVNVVLYDRLTKARAKQARFAA